jgi:cytidylate kinase
MDKYVITLSRQFASLGRSIAEEVSNNLNIRFYDRDIVEATAKRMGQPISTISKQEETNSSRFFKRKYPLGMGAANIQEEIFNVQTNIIQDLAESESCIIVGRCSNYVLEDYPNAFHIFIYAPYEERLKNCINILKMKPGAARKMLHDVDQARENYRLQYCKNISSLYDGYDLMIDSSRFGVSKTAKIISNLIE